MQVLCKLFRVSLSLSEPHTSVTALHMRVCIYLSIYLPMLVWTNHLNQRIQILHDD